MSVSELQRDTDTCTNSRFQFHALLAEALHSLPKTVICIWCHNLQQHTLS